jgi:hypothetical protein
MAVFYPEYARSRHQAAAQAEFQVAFVFHRVVSPNMPILSDFATSPSRKMQPSLLRRDRLGTLTT